MRDAGVTRRDLVVDIGAGAGLLTEALADVGARVLAVEIDVVLVERLRARVADRPSVRVLAVDFGDLRLPRRPFRVVANVPFSATSAVLHRLLDDPCIALTAIDVVLQRQVVDRLVGVGRRDAVAWSPWWHFERGALLHRSVFRPPPKVDAAVLVARRRDRPLLAPHDALRYHRFVARRWNAQRSRPPEWWARRFTDRR